MAVMRGILPLSTLLTVIYLASHSSAIEFDCYNCESKSLTNNQCMYKIAGATGRHVQCSGSCVTILGGLQDNVATYFKRSCDQTIQRTGCEKAYHDGQSAEFCYCRSQECNGDVANHASGSRDLVHLGRIWCLIGAVLAILSFVA